MYLIILNMYCNFLATVASKNNDIKISDHSRVTEVEGKKWIFQIVFIDINLI